MASMQTESRNQQNEDEEQLHLNNNINFYSGQVSQVWKDSIRSYSKSYFMKFIPIEIDNQSIFNHKSLHFLQDFIVFTVLLIESILLTIFLFIISWFASNFISFDISNHSNGQYKSVNIINLAQFKNKIKPNNYYQEPNIMNSKQTPFASLDNIMQHPQTKKVTAPQQQQAKVESHYTLAETPLIKPTNRVQLKIAFLKYSRIHYHYKLRYSTLFHATFLYIKCLNLLSDKKISFSQDYLTIICLFLSMKYEEIYPPKLHHITSYFKSPPVDAAIYRQQEAKILNILEGSLDVVTFKDIIDELLENQSNEVHALAYYLFQLSLFDILIPSTFDMKDICSAIMYIMAQTCKLSQNTLKLERVVCKNAVTCSKLIVSAIDRLKTNEVDFIRKKYQAQQICSNISRQFGNQNK